MDCSRCRYPDDRKPARVLGIDSIRVYAHGKELRQQVKAGAG